MERPQKGQRPRDGQDEAVKSGPSKSCWRGTEVRPWRRGDSSEYPVNQGAEEGRLHVLFVGWGHGVLGEGTWEREACDVVVGSS